MRSLELDIDRDNETFAAGKILILIGTRAYVSKIFCAM